VGSEDGSGVDVRLDGAAALEWVAGYLDRLREHPVLSRIEPGEIRASFPAAPPDEPEPFAAVLDDLDRVLMPGITHWQSPRYFAYFATTASEPAILAELLAASLNQVGILWRTSPALQELEQTTADWLRQLLGLPDEYHGHIEDSASTSTLVSLAVARDVAAGRRVVLASEHAHSSIEKACRLLELDFRKLPVDDAFRMRLDGLELGDACAVVAAVGTTATSAIDPVAELAELCATAGVWLHVDAAYAGSAAVCPELRQPFSGWERADSIVVNPHKWLATPSDCSVLWTRRLADFRRSFSLVPEYLRSDDETVNLSEITMALGRRFRALKLWAVLRCYGRSGLQERIREHVRLAQLFAGWVRDERGWEVSAPHPFSLVCFRLDRPDAVNEALLERVNASGEVFLSHARLHDRTVLRLAIGNFRTTEDDVRLAWDVLRREAALLGLRRVGIRSRGFPPRVDAGGVLKASASRPRRTVFTSGMCGCARWDPLARIPPRGDASLRLRAPARGARSGSPARPARCRRGLRPARRRRCR
jgi:aromatic-L-amino-acid/L-tryptophan decarboxylase